MGEQGGGPIGVVNATDKPQVLLKCPGAAAEGDLHRLAQPTDAVLSRQRVDEGRVNDDGGGWVEVARKVLVRPHVDRALATDARVGHAEQGRGDVRPRETPHVQRCGEGGDVLHDASADGDDLIASPHAQIAKCADEHLTLAESLVALHRLERDQALPPAGEGAREVGIGDDHVIRLRAEQTRE